ncbi:hypothetical protein EW146_g4303 [Bondarzewia mesenterica]|uniref:Uncharacterized protein n=1 Tax=Bondarzewia mesenterica TaxID=1095465 RepID=A0A4S4LUX9_9AGAM|nr:hypothetical protein EW146_g4303 [Bondarzewia mesenterica]
MYSSTYNASVYYENYDHYGVDWDRVDHYTEYVGTSQASSPPVATTRHWHSAYVDSVSYKRHSDSLAWYPYQENDTGIQNHARSWFSLISSEDTTTRTDRHQQQSAVGSKVLKVDHDDLEDGEIEVEDGEIDEDDDWTAPHLPQSWSSCTTEHRYQRFRPEDGSDLHHASRFDSYDKISATHTSPQLPWRMTKAYAPSSEYACRCGQGFAEQSSILQHLPCSDFQLSDLQGRVAL